MKRWGLALLFSVTAVASPSSVDWTPLSGAEKYELQFRSLSDPKLQTRTVPGNTTTWEENLADGVYVYRLRGIDTFGRPGKWTDVNVLVVFGLPTLKEPTAGTPVTPGPVRFSWSGSEGVKRYLLVVKKDGQNLVTEKVEGTEWRAEKLEAGEYAWSVRPLVDRAPNFGEADLTGEWEGPESEMATLTVAEKPAGTTERAYAIPTETAPEPIVEAPKLQTKRVVVYRRTGLFLKVGPGYYAQKYNGQVGSASVQGSSDMAGPGFFLHAGYLVTPRISVQALWDQLHYRIAETNVSRQSIQFVGTYATKVSGVGVTPHGGFELRRFFSFLPTATGFRETVIGAVGLSFGVTLEKPLSEKFSAALRFDCHPPLALLASASSGSITGIALGNNLGADLSLLYRLTTMTQLLGGVVVADRGQDFVSQGQTSSVTDRVRGAYAALRFQW